jgi:poly(3-hydroxybutyrate) depolymerase
VNVISVCQPTVPVLAAVSLLASRGEFTPRTMTMMGGPIDARKSPTAVNNLAMNKSHDWFEHNVIYRVPPNYPGAGRRVYPGFLQHTGFVAMNPDRHLSSHYDYFLDLVRGDGDSADSPPPVLRRVQRRARHAGRVLPRHHQDRVPGLRAGQRHLARQRRTGAPTGHQDHRLADHRRRARRHLRRRPDPRSPRPVHRHPKARQFHYDVVGAGHYGIFSGRRWREKVYPEVREFIAEANTAPARRPRATAKLACRLGEEGEASAPDNRSVPAPKFRVRTTPRLDRRRPAADAVHALRLSRLRRLCAAVAAGEAGINRARPAVPKA